MKRSDVFLMAVKDLGYTQIKYSDFKDTTIAKYEGGYKTVIINGKPEAKPVVFSLIVRETDTDFLLSVVGESIPFLYLDLFSELDDEEEQYYISK